MNIPSAKNIPSRLDLLHEDLMEIADALDRLHPVHPVAISALVKAHRHLVNAMMDLHRAQIAESLSNDRAAPTA